MNKPAWEDEKLFRLTENYDNRHFILAASGWNIDFCRSDINKTTGLFYIVGPAAIINTTEYKLWAKRVRANALTLLEVWKLVNRIPLKNV